MTAYEYDSYDGVGFVPWLLPEQLPDAVLLAVVAIGPAMLPPSPAAPNGGEVVGGVHMQLNCPLPLAIATLQGCVDRMTEELETQRRAATN